ncbi:uncharacterized protein LOC144640907 isoform X1 [Oculina patagonica]
MVIALAGNVDADPPGQRMVNYEDAESYAKDNGLFFMEVSPNTAMNVDELFLSIGNRVLDVARSGLLRLHDPTEKDDAKVLNLTYCGLTELPTRIERLTNLTKLNVSYNKLMKLPESIGVLVNLLHLFANNNQLSLLPASMKRLAKLQELDLRNNKLKGPFQDVGDLEYLQKLYLEGNPLTLQVIKSLLALMDRKLGTLSIDIAAVTPAEILAQGDGARLLYEKALREGSVNVYRGRVLFIGQDSAGKTSLKKSLLGLPFDPKEKSTEGIEVDPSKCEIEIDRIKNWRSTGESKPSLSEFVSIARVLAENRYQAILGEEKDDSRTKSEKERPRESKIKSMADLEAKSGNSSLTNQIAENGNKLKKADISSPARKMQVQNGGSSANARKKSHLMIDATKPPEDVTKQADQWLKYMFLEGPDADNATNKSESLVTLDLWDFAGQHLYYASHPVFLSSRAIYILVHNLSKPLNSPAQPCVRQGIHDVLLENPNGETNLENLLSWLVTVHSLIPTEEGMVSNSERMLPYLRPPVFIVGTHADKPFEDIKTMTSKIKQGISGKEYEKHVIRPFFSIDNTQSSLSLLGKIKNFLSRQPQRRHQEGQRGDTGIAGDDEIDALQTRIMEVLRQEPYMGERIPLRWFNFEKVIEALVAENIYHMNLKQLQTYAKKVCFIDDVEQFHTMLNFYHNLGMIVKYRSTVVLKAQWLIDLFKQLITIPPFDKVDPVHSKYWQEVEESGVLRMELVDHVFSRFIQQGIIKEDILDMMERFGLIAKFSLSPTNVKYFVPAQLKSSPKGLCEIEPSPSDPCPLYLHFVDGFVPHGLFSQLVSKATSWCSESGYTRPPNLYLNGARFVIGTQIIHNLILICTKRFVKIVLKYRIQDDEDSMLHSTEVATSVRQFVEGTLQNLSQELPCLSGLRYKFCVACPYCLQGDHECENHSQPSCAHEDCLHLLEVKQGQRLICMKSFGDKVLTVRGVEKWFSERTSQVLSPSTITNTSQGATMQDCPEDCRKTLRVALLASEWSSSMGGLSTINRQLATLLAKQVKVEVTLLVPQFACSEGEKRAARSHNVVIREAERRPGYNDPLDWLSFPPRDLAIDVVLGHGGKLGKQAQVIRESHSCKWIQVVHTAPEELGMYKNYPKAIFKGEEKNRTEVDLCKLANLVVAVGPKLTKAYSSYLRSCEKHQDIFQLTPGTFSEFFDVQQATNESEEFKVLTFGRGDPEDFSLKGYDIAAKAIVELEDRSFRLIFVGAPDGKQDDVAENLLQSGISKDQLIVRKFVQSKERLKELFCEVDLAIMPSRTEGFGLTALEALSAGLPILVSGNSGFGDALRALPSGKSFVVESNDPKEWAKAITAVRLKERAQRLQEIQALMTCYEENYSWEKQCDALVQKMWSIVHG